MHGGDFGGPPNGLEADCEFFRVLQRPGLFQCPHIRRAAVDKTGTGNKRARKQQGKGNVSHGFCVGRMMISLMKLCGSCITSIRTAYATSSGRSIFSRAFDEPEKEVFVEPGQMTLARMPYCRTSSASDSVNPT